MVQALSSMIRVLNAAKGSKMNFTLSKGVLNQVAKEAPFGQQLQQALSKCKDPVVNVSAKASEKGYSIATLSLKDGKENIGNLAFSITNPGSPNAILKMRTNMLNGKIQANAWQDLGKSPDIDNIALSIANRNGITNIEEITNNGVAHAKIHTKELAEYIKPGTYNQGIGKVNQLFARMTNSLRLFMQGEKVNPLQFAFGKTFKKTDKFVKVEQKLKATDDIENMIKKANVTDDIEKLKAKSYEIEKKLQANYNKKYETIDYQKEKFKQLLEKAKYEKIDVSDILS